MAELGIGVFTGTRTTAIWGPDKVRGVRLRDLTEIACDLVVVAAGIRPNTDVAADQRLHRRAGHRGRRPDADRRGRRRVRGGGVRPAPRRGLRPGRPAVGAGGRAGRPDHRRRSRRALPRARGPRPSSRWPGSRWPRWASPSRSGTPTSTSSSPNPKQGHLQVDRDPRRQDHRRHPARRQPQGRLPAAGLRPRPAAAGGAGRADVRPRRSQRRRSASPRWPTTRRSATATASARATSVARCKGGCKTVSGGDGQDPGRQGLRLLQGSGRPARGVRRRRRGGGGPGGPLLRAGHPDGQAGADGRDPRPRT